MSRRSFLSLFSVIALAMGLVASLVSCTKARQPQKIPSYQPFSIVQNIPLTSTCDEKCVSLKKEFRYVVYVGQQIYCYWDEKKKETGSDFDQIAADIESRISSTTSAQDYYLLLMEWAASFHDGHVNVMMGNTLPENFEFYDPNVRFELLAPASVTEKLIISKVGDDVSLLKPGTEVRTIGGRPWQESLQEAVRFTSGSTDRMRRNQAAKWLLPFILGTKETFKDLPIEGILNGQVVKENISRVLTLSDGNAEPPPAATGKGSINARIINGNIGYLRIDAFMGTKMDILLDQAMSRLLHTEGLLIDVRLNGGGTPVGDRVLSYLIEQEIMRYSAKIRNSDMLMAMQPLYATGFDFINGNWSEVWQYKVQPNAHGKYKKPVVVLTSAYCFSACDTFVSALKENNLAKVAGEATGGGTGSPVVFNLPYSKFKFRYSVQKGYKAVSGDLLEGVGTGVDLDISPTAQERIAEKDEQLKTAVAYLKSLMTDQPTLQFHLNSVAEENSEFERAADRQPLRSPLLEMESEILKSNFEN